ncbi:MAG: QueT transporter family protein [Oscillospiraceae bacterium]|nr:QueT transporter family protein [Oscillospiraceae bacterium]
MMKTSRLARAGLIAAVYVVLNLLLPFGFGPIQFRLSEALCLLPMLFPESVWALFIGCAVSNLLGLGMGLTTPWDVLFGSLATLLAALWTRKCKSDFTAPIPAILLNAVIVGTMLTAILTPGSRSAWLYHMMTVGLSELIVLYVFGLPLLKVLRRLEEKKESGIR